MSSTPRYCRVRFSTLCDHRGKAAWWTLSLAWVVGLAGCSLVLEEPLPFTSSQQDARGEEAGAGGGSADASPDARRPTDATRPVDASVVDARRPVDARPTDAAPVRDRGAADAGPRPDAQGDADPSSDARPVADAAADADPPDADPNCVPQPEICNGVDDDCDGRVDEDDPAQCDHCGPEGGRGLCEVGVRLCVNGALRCVAWLPPEDAAAECDLLDNDCDGTVDETGELARVRDVQERRAWQVCGPREGAVAAPPVDECADTPGLVGCDAPHACVSPGCAQNCADEDATGRTACDAECARRGTQVEREGCFGDCRVALAGARLRCLTRCADVAQLATRWTCRNGPGGSICTAANCPAGMRPVGQTCVPNVEICNNGLDDDDDGVIDGTLGDNDVCMARYDLRGETLQRGVCADPDLPGCEDTRRLTADRGTRRSETCARPDCQPDHVSLSYPYALDREEVSIRAYAECVASGCCLPPSGRTYARASAALAAGPVPSRPSPAPRCAPPPDPLGDSDALLDLPVTGVSWCQARDYCNWVGKRLPTEFEWEQAAAGHNPRRAFPWGDESPAQCADAQCCRAPDHLGPIPAVCEGETPVCPANWPPESRLACLSIYNVDDPACAPEPGPAPVYANADGQTPEGVRNLAGNVAEWVFDWAGDAYTHTSGVDPAGQACDFAELSDRRMTRGNAYTAPGGSLRALNRTPLFPSIRVPLLGFRCARTLTDAQDACDPRMPEVPAVCRPGADARRAHPGRVPPRRCAAPDFQTADELDRSTCEGAAQRLGSGECVSGLERFCAAEPLAPDGCSAFLLNRFRVPSLPGDQDEARAETLSTLNIIFDGTLGPQGGNTLFALNLPPGFDTAQQREWAAEFGSVQVNAEGRLSWLGLLDGPNCQRAPSIEFNVRTTGGRSITPVCRASGVAQLWFRDAPLSLQFSAMGMTGSYERVSGLLNGVIALVATPADIRRSTFGSPDAHAGERGLDEVFSGLGVAPLNLCNMPLPVGNLFACADQPLTPPGCRGSTCEDPEQCTGFILLLDYEAIRADAAGIPGLTGCGG